MPKVYGFTSYGDSDTQEFWDQPVPSPGPADLLIAVKAAAVNPVDVKYRNGDLQAFVPLDLPAPLGSEASGVVQEVGQDVEGFAVGDEVFGLTSPNSGGFAEYTLLTAADAAKKPVHVSFEDASTLAVAGRTAFDAVAQLKLSEGATLLINGVGGGVGVAAAQLARDTGVTVIGVGGEGKRDLAESLGVTYLDYHAGPVAEQVRQILPDGVDAVFDLIGGPALRDVATLVADPARLVSAADPATATELGGSGVQHGDSTTVLAELARLVGEGKLDPHARDVLPLDQAAEALHGVESGHSRGKVVIRVS